MLDEDEVRRPDLAIYSQSQAISQDQDPTWDSPDILTNDWGPFRLLPEARVTVRNLGTASATNAYVHFFTSPFGIGTRRRLSASRRLSLSPGAAVELPFPLDQETLSGDPRVGVHVELEHPHDSQALNNAGSQVHDGSYTTEVGRAHAIEFPVVNDSNFTRRIHLSVLPTDLIVSLTPQVAQVYAPHSQIAAHLEIRVPGFLTGTPAQVVNRAVTVVARTDDGELVGGLTKLLRIDS